MMDLYKKYNKLVKHNMASFWQTCLSVDSQYLFQDNASIQYTITDIDDALLNVVLSSKLVDDQLEEQVNNIVSLYSKKHLSFCWMIDTKSDSPSLERYLQTLGFKLFGNVSGMLMPVPSQRLDWSAEIGIDEVSSEEQFAQWIQPMVSSFQMSALSAQKYLRIFQLLNESTNPFSHFTATVKNKVVACSTLYKGEQAAGIYNCATLSEFRKQGILSTLVKMMINKSRAQGYQYITLQASPMAQNTFKQLGFDEIVPYKIYLMTTGGDKGFADDLPR